MNKTYLLIGGNMGDRSKNLEIARNHLAASCGPILRCSSLYETEAWGKTDQPSFLNQAIELETPMTPHQLLKKMLDIESLMGRKRQEKYGPRIIDIDILLFNQEEYDDASLKIPHPELQNRRFALVPLAEIAAHVVHPALHKTILKLLDECPDHLKVRIYH